MPIVRVTTTSAVTVPADLDGFEAGLADKVADTIGKDKLPIVFVMVSPNTRIYNKPRNPNGKGKMVLLEIQSMQAFSADNVASVQKALIEYLSEKLETPRDSILVALTDIPVNFAGVGADNKIAKK